MAQPNGVGGFRRANHHGMGNRLPDLLDRRGARGGLVLDRLPAGCVVADERHLVVGPPADEVARPRRSARSLKGTRSGASRGALLIGSTEDIGSNVERFTAWRLIRMRSAVCH